jgi:hypothetical protein
MSSDSSTDTEVQLASSEIVKSVSIVLFEIISENKDITTKQEPSGNSPLILDKLHNLYNSKKPPSISIGNYFERIVKYSKLEESTLIVTLIYIDRLCDLTGIILTDKNIHR